MKNAEEDLALNDLFGLEIGLESQTIWCICKMNESDFDLVENDSFISNSNSSEDKEEEAFEVYLLSQPIQCLAISFIIIVAIVCNSLVIHNICMCQVSITTLEIELSKLNVENLISTISCQMTAIFLA